MHYQYYNGCGKPGGTDLSKNRRRKKGKKGGLFLDPFSFPIPTIVSEINIKNKNRQIYHYKLSYIL